MTFSQESAVAQRVRVTIAMPNGLKVLWGLSKEESSPPKKLMPVEGDGKEINRGGESSNPTRDSCHVHRRVLGDGLFVQQRHVQLHTHASH
jgi:hypothetical protein